MDPMRLSHRATGNGIAAQSQTISNVKIHPRGDGDRFKSERWNPFWRWVRPLSIPDVEKVYTQCHDAVPVSAVCRNRPRLILLTHLFSHTRILTAAAVCI